jgi:hypothetical protein
MALPVAATWLVVHMNVHVQEAAKDVHAQELISDEVRKFMHNSGSMQVSFWLPFTLHLLSILLQNKILFLEQQSGPRSHATSSTMAGQPSPRPRDRPYRQPTLELQLPSKQARTALWWS